MLQNRYIALGITGSIAAYKAADLASKLTQAGARVDVLMTEAATHFITPLTLRSLTGRQVFIDMFDPTTELAEQHVEIARRADAVIVAPASATTIARLAQGLADDVVSLTVLATEAPVLVAPAMDHQMYENAATQANLETLRQRGYTIVGPAEGRLASGRMGLGRLEETEVLIGAVKQALGRRGDLAGRRVVVSAGGTQEAIDPVRFVGNHSSGKMGYALAEAARDRGAEVTLVTAPTALACPYGVRLVSVQSAREMRDAVVAACQDADALIMAAAVADFQPGEAAEQKIRKAGKKGLTLELVPTPDILSEVRGDLVRVGFKAESRELLESARELLRRKQLDLVVANDVTAAGSGFATDTNQVTIIDASGQEEALPLLPKYDVANRVLDRVAALLRERGEAP
ncbi:MAG: phosphopantothenoylcysteine decarboxylase [Chloroflexi bacterium RBG_16_68_14]|nr:MAG: phosphopantothenoylcysteine decarboxylase [Chloroflexi bacterium RBG_16_68_14]